MATTEDYNLMAVISISERATLSSMKALNDELDRYQAEVNSDVFTDYGAERDTFVAHAIADMILRFERDLGHTRVSEKVTNIVNDIHDFEQRQAQRRQSRRHQP